MHKNLPSIMRILFCTYFIYDYPRIVVPLATHHGWKVHQLDFKTTFLNCDLQEEVSVKQLSDLASNEKRIWFVVCIRL